MGSNKIGGRKPTPASMVDNSKYKKSPAELERRILVETALADSDAKLICPKHLCPEAKKEWKRIIGLYKKLESRILCDLDITALSMYCEAVALYRSAQQVWVSIGSVVSDDEEVQFRLNKAIKTMNEQTKIITSLAEQLCLTPVGRARMGLMKQKDNAEDEGLDDLL